MLKFVRNSAIENPWFFRSIIILIAVTFVISMGWVGFSGEGKPYVAKIDGTLITRVEYDRYKENAYRYYRDLLQENFKPEIVNQFVINNLIEQRLWMKLASDLRLSIGVEELRETLQRDPTFHDAQGRFDPDRYQFFLSRSRLMASEFEQSIRDELLIHKAKRVLQDGIALTRQEVEEAKKSVTDSELPPEQRVEEETRTIENALVRKQQRALQSALNQIRSAAQIEIIDHYL